jgi:hypothetical protein
MHHPTTRTSSKQTSPCFYNAQGDTETRRVSYVRRNQQAEKRAVVVWYRNNKVSKRGKNQPKNIERKETIPTQVFERNRMAKMKSAGEK